MKTFDDFDIAVANTPITEDGMPVVGDIVEGKRILRVKPILLSSVVFSIRNNWEVAGNLLFKEHGSRPPVMWLLELES